MKNKIINLRKVFLIIVPVVLLAFMVAPTVFGQSVSPGPIVPCDGVSIDGKGLKCDFAALLRLAHNIMNFFISISIPLSAIAFAYAGYLFLTAAGNAGQVSKAKEIFTKVLIGFIFVLTAWLIVRTITSALLCDPADPNCSYYDLLERFN